MGTTPNLCMAMTGASAFSAELCRRRFRTTKAQTSMRANLAGPACRVDRASFVGMKPMGEALPQKCEAGPNRAPPAAPDRASFVGNPSVAPPEQHDKRKTTCKPN